jgi:hypothetical protein
MRIPSHEHEGRFSSPQMKSGGSQAVDSVGTITTSFKIMY